MTTETRKESATAVRRSLLYRAGTVLSAFAMLFAALCAASAEVPMRGMDLYLLMGQSNMAGSGVLSDDCAVNADGVYKLDEDGGWQIAREPIHSEKGAGAGLAASFARAMVDRRSGVKIGLIPCAVGGSGIDRWVEGGDLWSNAVARTRIAQRSGTLKGVLWHQGELDSLSRRLTGTWGGKLASLVRSVRKEFGPVPFVAGELGHYLGSFRANARWREINEQMHDLERMLPDYCVVSASGLSANPDNLHFNTESLREFGLRYADAMLRLMSRAGDCEAARMKPGTAVPGPRFGTAVDAGASDMVSMALGDATIEVAVDNPSTRLAASELAKHLELVCGIRPKTVRENGRFVLGRGPEGAPTPLDCESFARLENGVVYCWGDDRSHQSPIQGWGTACGVYGFLEKVLGIRWVFPGDDGIVFRPQQAVGLPANWQYRHRPLMDKNEIRLRAGSWGKLYDAAKVPMALRLSPEELEKEDQDRRLWPLRQRLQTRDSFAFGHAFSDWQKRFLKTHPEYIAMNRDGTRGQSAERAIFAQQCLSNPAVQDQMIADWKKAGQPRRLNLCANDSWYHCRCPSCCAWDADLPGEDFMLHKTDRMVRFYNVMTEKAAKLRPDVEVCAYAYLDFRYAPRRERIKYPDKLIVAFVPSIYDDFAQVVDGWLAAGLRRFVIRPNYLCYNGFVPRGYERQFYEEFRRFAKMGMIGNDEGSFNRDVILNFETYVFARLMAEPEIGFEEIEDEFLSQYGSAEPEMREYYHRVRARGEKEREDRTRTRAYDVEAATRDDGEFCDNAVGGHSADDMAADVAVLDRALAKPGISEVERRRIHAVRIHVELAIHARRVWDVFVKWRGNRGDESLCLQARRESRAMLEFACAHPGELRDSWPRVIPRPSYVGNFWKRFGLLDEFLEKSGCPGSANH